MNLVENRYEGGLKPLKVRCITAAVLFLIVAVTCVNQFRARRLLEMTADGLTRAQGGLARVKEANTNLKRVLTALKSQFGPGLQNRSPEMILYGKIDEIKARLNPDDMTVTSVEKKGGEASLQYSLTFKNHDFNSLLNAVSYLHGAVFPLTPVSSITVSRAVTSGADGVTFAVAGKVISIEKTSQ